MRQLEKQKKMLTFTTNLKHKIMSTKKLHKQDKNAIDIKLSAAILLAIDAESNFKLYSYRICPPEQFIARMDEIVQLYQTAKKAIND